MRRAAALTVYIGAMGRKMTDDTQDKEEWDDINEDINEDS